MEIEYNERFFLYIFLLFNILLHYTYIKYLKKKKHPRCKCSRDWKRIIVQYGPLIHIFINLIIAFLIGLFKTRYDILIPKSLYNITKTTLLIIYILYIYKLIEIKCECARDWRGLLILIISTFGILDQIILFIKKK